jgi:hypothetical protein
MLVPIFLLVALLSISIIPVQAGKGGDKKDFTFTWEGMSYGLLGAPEVTGRITHVGLWFETGPDGMITLEIDGETYYEYGENLVGDSDFEYYGEMYYEAHLAWDTEKDFNTIHWWYTLDFGEGNVITVKANGINYNTDPMTHWGNVVGFGTGIFENVKIKGTAYNAEGTGLITHSGTIMGWPDMS